MQFFFICKSNKINILPKFFKKIKLWRFDQLFYLITKMNFFHWYFNAQKLVGTQVAITTFDDELVNRPKSLSFFH